MILNHFILKILQLEQDFGVERSFILVGSRQISQNLRLFGEQIVMLEDFCDGVNALFACLERKFFT